MGRGNDGPYSHPHTMMQTTTLLTLATASEACLAVNELFYSNSLELVRNLRTPNNLREESCQGTPDERNK